MTDVRTDSPRPSGRRPATGRGGRIAVGLAAGLLILLAALYLNKRAVTRQVLVGWLERQGIDADVAVERVTLDGIIARVRLGDPPIPTWSSTGSRSTTASPCRGRRAEPA